MKTAIIIVLLLLAASVADATVNGQIKDVSWGISGQSGPITTVKPLVIIENTGDQPARYHIAVAVDRDGKRYAGACWETEEIGINKTGMTWPHALRVPSQSDLDYLQIELYSDLCLKSDLLDIKKKR